MIFLPTLGLYMVISNRQNWHLETRVMKKKEVTTLLKLVNHELFKQIGSVSKCKH